MKKLLMALLLTGTVFTASTHKAQAAEIAAGVTIGGAISYTFMVITLASSMHHAEEAMQLQTDIAEFEATGELSAGLVEKTNFVFAEAPEATLEEALDAIADATDKVLE